MRKKINYRLVLNNLFKRNNHEQGPGYGPNWHKGLIELKN